MKEAKKQSGKKSGFALADLAIGLVIVGLLIAAILGGSSMINNSRIRKQVKDLQGLYAGCYSYFDKFEQLPGDRDGNGEFDTDSTVWNDLEQQNLARQVHRSPFGGTYVWGWSGDSNIYHRMGNYVSINVPLDVAANIDMQLDDGAYNTGSITASADYTGSGRIDLYYFID